MMSVFTRQDPDYTPPLFDRDSLDNVCHTAIATVICEMFRSTQVNNGSFNLLPVACSVVPALFLPPISDPRVSLVFWYAAGAATTCLTSLLNYT